MTDDNPTRGLHQSSADGTTNPSVVQPSHIETVAARLDDGKLWKYSRYFDNPQFWSGPDTPQDVVQEQVDPNPNPEDPQPGTVRVEVTVKSTPEPDKFELYNLTDDPVELKNLYGVEQYSSQQTVLAGLLAEQRAQKRLTPESGEVPGQPD